MKGKQNGKCCSSVARASFQVLSGYTWLAAVYQTAQREDLPSITESLLGSAGLWTVWTLSPASDALGRISIDP